MYKRQVFLVPDTDGKLVEMKAELARRIKTKKEAEAFLNACKGAAFAIEDITTRPLKKTPPAPFTTSTLQQEAARKLGYTVAQTMMVAQRLYESGDVYKRQDIVHSPYYVPFIPILTASTFEKIKTGTCEQRCWFNSCLLYTSYLHNQNIRSPLLP